MYKSVIKRIIDIVFSFFGIVFLALPMLIIVIAIKIDSRGPAVFTQKRVGIHKTYFKILKFRTMYADAPHDIPTHMFQKPDKWITKVGGFLRKFSLDELPQLFNIFVGHMSIIGPRPALWNQYDLIAERDKYGANDVRPGLSGLAQISGRDALDIPEKSRYDGEYVSNLTFGMDWKCFWGSFKSIVDRHSVIEGETVSSESPKEMSQSTNK